MLQFGLRLGEDPKQLITTTPRPIALLKRLLSDASTYITRAATYENRANLAESFFRQVISQYEDSNLGRQELNGELIETPDTGLFCSADIEKHRVRKEPSLDRIVIAVDPPVSSGPEADECGIVVAGVSGNGHIFVLADLSCQGYSPMAWAERVVCGFHDFGCDRVVAETNQGGELVDTVIQQVDPAVPVRRVHATRGKVVRAEPVAALYEQGRVHHVGLFAALEDQMRLFGGDKKHSGSPDRVDSLVWALTDLTQRARLASPRSRRL